ncbi:MAG TPA: HPr family phosphocarrier protein [Lacunisphaera sp.]|nr:HPr family phosphocarrier protein [Lacunisphaera sp.]
MKRNKTDRVHGPMLHAKVKVPWPEGLHLRQAMRLVRATERFRSRMFARCGGRRADLRSVVSLLALCATLGTTLDIEINGDDEQDAAQTVDQVFLG